jgi:hypothetical protein
MLGMTTCTREPSGSDASTNGEHSSKPGNENISDQHFVVLEVETTLAGYPNGIVPGLTFSS